MELLSVLGSTGEVSPGSIRFLWRAARLQWHLTLVAWSLFLFPSCPQTPMESGDIQAQHPTPGAVVMHPLTVLRQAQVTVYILWNNGDTLAQIPGSCIAAGWGFLSECVLHTHRIVFSVAAIAPASTVGHLLLFIEAAGQALIFYPICPGKMV